MTDPTRNHPVTPPPLTNPWTTQDPYAPYAGAAQLRSSEPYAGGPAEPLPYQPYAGGPGYTGPADAGPQYGTPPSGVQRPPAHWPLSIVGVLFSILLGAIAIYFSVQVGKRWDRGDLAGAQKASRHARTLGIVAIVAGVIGTAIIIGTGSR
jgi:hypothetical protein